MSITRVGCSTSNFRRGRPIGFHPEAIVIHSLESDLATAERAFNTPGSQRSAHFGVSKRGEVHQYVEEKDTAFHAGIVINPTWTLLKPKVNPNFYTIGIEHEGPAENPWPAEQLAASARLIAEIAARWSIPLDGEHVIRHQEIRASANCPGKGLGSIENLFEALAFRAAGGAGARTLPSSTKRPSPTVVDLSAQLKRRPAGTGIEPPPTVITFFPRSGGGALSQLHFPANFSVRTVAKVHLRSRPNTAADILESIPEGTEVSVSGFDIAEEVNGNPFWYLKEAGNYFWAGATDRPQPISVGKGAPLPASVPKIPSSASVLSDLFPRGIIDLAVQSERKFRVPASVTLAQWAQESGFGRSSLALNQNNPFGITAGGDEHGFQHFDSIPDAFDAHGRLLATNDHYIAAMRHTNDPNAFADALTGVYAKDPQYGAHLKKLMQKYNLYQFDAANITEIPNLVLKPPHGLEEIKATFGNIFDFIRSDKSLDPAWEAMQIVHAALPFPIVLSGHPAEHVNSIQCHVKLANIMPAVFADIERKNLADKIREYGGCYEFRPKHNLTGTSDLSVHSWGIAIDLNPTSNPLGSHGDMDLEIVEIFRNHGFMWGGDFSAPKDPMHFQYCTGY